jgi:hypothetical protein
MLADDLIQAEKDYPVEWIEKAFKIAVTNNQRKWGYVLACLKNMQTNGVDWKPGKQEQAAPEAKPLPLVSAADDPDKDKYIPAPERPRRHG